MFNSHYQSRNRGDKICRFYFSKKGCRFKNSCLYSHVKPVNWFTQECWFHLNDKCAFGKWCFNYHRNKNIWFTIRNHPQEKGKKKIYTPKSSETSNKNGCSVSTTNTIRLSNVKESDGGTQKEKLCPNENINSLKCESYSFLKREMKMLKSEVIHLKDLVKKMITNSHINTECIENKNSIQAMVDTGKILNDRNELSGNAQIDEDVKKNEPLNMQEKSSKWMKEGFQQGGSSNKNPKLAIDGLEIKKEVTGEKSTNNQRQCLKTKHPDFWKNLAIKGKRK